MLFSELVHGIEKVSATKTVERARDKDDESNRERAGKALTEGRQTQALTTTHVWSGRLRIWPDKKKVVCVLSPFIADVAF